MRGGAEGVETKATKNEKSSKLSRENIRYKKKTIEGK